MPKHKKKRDAKTGALPGKSSQSRAQSGDDNSEYNADENASTISNASTNMSYQDLDSNEDPSQKAKQTEDLVEKIDNIDSQINSCLDGLLEKGFKEREESLKILKKLFSNKYVVEHLNAKRFTLTESLLRCIKRGKLNEQLLASDVLMLTFIQLGYSIEAAELLSESKSMLIEIIEDEKCEPEIRANCVRTLGLAILIANENSTDTISVLDKFESLFACAYAKGDGTLRTFTPKMYELHSAALSTWCLLLCILPLPYVNQISQRHVRHFLDFLKSPDLELRIVAGETIAFLFGLAQCDSHSDLSCFEDEDLIETLKNLANDSSKHKSKKDKKQQRSSFRDILRTIEEGEFETQVIKLGTESLYLDNWIRRKQYHTFCDLLGTGMNMHLQENEFIRDIFDLGPAPVGSGTSRNLSLASKTRMEKAQFNKEQFRNRTKWMNKKRENKGTLAHDADDD